MLNPVAELDRGFAYLRRFKTLSHAFQTGNYRQLANLPATIAVDQTIVGDYGKIPLYSKLEEPLLKTPRLHSEHQLDAEAATYKSSEVQSGFHTSKRAPEGRSDLRYRKKV